MAPPTKPAAPPSGFDGTQKIPVPGGNNVYGAPPAAIPLPGGNNVYGAPPTAIPLPGGTNVYAAPPAAVSPTQLSEFILRAFAFATTFIAAIVMGVDKQTKTFSLTDSGDALDVTLQTTGLSQFNYFIAANAIACAYSVVSLAMSVVTRGPSAKNLALPLTIADLAMVAFLFSGNGSASAITVLGKNGAGFLWVPVCDSYGKLCGNLAAAIVMSMLGTVAYVALVLLAVVGLHQRSP